MAWENYGRMKDFDKAEAFREAADYIELTVNERHAANIAALDKKQLNGWTPGRGLICGNAPLLKDASVAELVDAKITY